MSTPAARARSAPRGTPGGAYVDTPSMLSYTQQKAGVHLRAAPGLEPNRGASSSSSKPMMEKALAFRLKQHPSTRA